MRRMNRSILGAILALSLLLAPVTFAGDAADDGSSLMEWVQDVLDGLFGGDPPDDDENGDGLPNAGPAADPLG